MLSFILLTLLAHAYGNEEPAPMVRSRVMQTKDTSFVELSCNDSVGPCQRWSEKYPSQSVFTSRVTVPCGQCLEMDVKGELTFEDGLDIQGTLDFPEPSSPDSSLVIKSTMIVVQGLLKMRATKKVNGQFNYKFHMMEETEQFYNPIGENAGKCDGPCKAGMKSITVAGGKVDIVGMPITNPTWTKLAEVKGSNSILVDANVGNWQPGSEIMITPATDDGYDTHTHVISGTQVTSAGTILTLDSALPPTTSLKDDPIAAVEVALLSRNIVWEGSATTKLIGGHFWVFQTPNVAQRLEGVDITNFGQQGELGRYPIHLHHCKDTPDAVIKRNTVRHSNQRCVVIHGTNQATIEETVTMNTKGHCYLLEDSIEVQNKFIKNLSCLVDEPEKALEKESDAEHLSIFWITHPDNTFIGNVAAGCHGGAGFFFELFPERTRPLDNRGKALKEFKNNVAHANTKGMSFYPSGYRPIEEAVFEGTKVYRNGREGVHMNRSHNIIWKNSYFADHSKPHIITKGAGRFSVLGATIEHYTEDFKRIQQDPAGTKLCQRIALAHTRHGEWPDAKPKLLVDDVQFVGYGDASECKNTAIGSSVHGPPTQNTTNLEWKDNNGKFPIEFCHTARQDVDFWLADADGSLRPGGMPGSGSGVIIANLDRLRHFVDMSQCMDMPDRCALYCNTCFQSVYLNMVRRSKPYQLKVCRELDHSDCVFFNSLEERFVAGRTVMWAHMPPGKYVAHVVDEATQKFADLTAVKHYALHMSNVMCEGGIDLNDFTMVDEELSPAPVAAPVAAPSPTTEDEEGWENNDDYGDDDEEDYDDGDDGDVQEGEDEEGESSSCKGLFCGLGKK